MGINRLRTHWITRWRESDTIEQKQCSVRNQQVTVVVSASYVMEAIALSSESISGSTLTSLKRVEMSHKMAHGGFSCMTKHRLFRFRGNQQAAVVVNSFYGMEATGLRRLKRAEISHILAHGGSLHDEAPSIPFQTSISFFMVRLSKKTIPSHFRYLRV
ncbi:hypothetical protein CDAR_476471 [Caerostris darwini]|uniref:Uncharacterized protein n=1 Tax=Caerostris darwini TaxID=1538125 RepID=A0AAV4NEJ7_9ARAC|nr:hypothetical protein CDAR_476471 [Caerostris darwini]